MEAANESIFIRKEFDFELPVQLEKMIDELETAIKNHATYIDCIQDEIRSLSRYLDDDDKENQVIDYYCRRRWL
ncbi:MAG: hypothetical protein IJ733_10855 [Lachnospiraceae bacterium]|nr:hypothetical protein [Lachnospiraceae bacterium]